MKQVRLVLVLCLLVCGDVFELGKFHAKKEVHKQKKGGKIKRSKTVASTNELFIVLWSLCW
jgi:hypothetical protein